MAESRKNKLQIRNSTVDFLVFTKDSHEDGIEVRVQDQLYQSDFDRLMAIADDLGKQYSAGQMI